MHGCSFSNSIILQPQMAAPIPNPFLYTEQCTLAPLYTLPSSIFLILFITSQYSFGPSCTLVYSLSVHYWRPLLLPLLPQFMSFSSPGHTFSEHSYFTPTPIFPTFLKHKPLKEFHLAGHPYHLEWLHLLPHLPVDISSKTTTPATQLTYYITTPF